MTGTATTATQRIGLRPARTADRAFLLEVYAATRAEELALVPWSAAERDAFLRMQFDAQDAQYRQHNPDGTFDVVEVDGEPAGRFYVDRRVDDIRIVDLALLPRFRGAGTGTTLIRTVFGEAAATGRTVSIHVEIHNRAVVLYERLGFRPVADRGVYRLMQWAPA